MADEAATTVAGIQPGDRMHYQCANQRGLMSCVAVHGGYAYFVIPVALRNAPRPPYRGAPYVRIPLASVVDKTRTMIVLDDSPTIDPTQRSETQGVSHGYD